MNRLPFLLSAIAGASQQAAQQSALRSASSYNWCAPVTLGAGNDSTPDVYLRIPFLIGNPGFSSVRISLLNWLFSAYGIITTGCTPFTIIKAAFEANGAWTPLKWGGSRSVTINPGDTDILCDAPDMTPIGNVMGGTLAYVRLQIPATSAVKTGQYSQRAGFFGVGARMLVNPTTTTVVNGVDGVGNFTTSGAAPSQNGNFFPVVILVGVPLAAGKFSGFIGDSIVLGETLDTGFPVGVGGSNRAAFTDYATKANPISVINFGVGGGTLRTWLGDGSYLAGNNGAGITSTNTNAANAAKAAAYLKYCNIIFEQFVTNGVLQSGSGASVTFPGYPILWSMIRAASPGVHIKRTSAFPRSWDPNGVSADKYTTYAGQTDAANNGWPGWSTGGVIDYFEQYCQASVGTLVDSYLDYDMIRAPYNGSGPNRFFWITDGVSRYTDDGYHPNTKSFPIIYGTQARAAIDALPATL